jgi:hypothetical protein
MDEVKKWEFDVSQLPAFDRGGKYLGQYEMGLYPGGCREMPVAHREAGQRIAATVQPLDVAGARDEKQGKIIALVMGHSNCNQYFAELQIALQENAGQLHPRFEMLNAAVGGQQLQEIRPLQGKVWDKAAGLLAQPGYSPQQVQVLFLHTTYHNWKNVNEHPPREFPQVMQQMQADMEAVLAHCLTLYPNLKIAYLTSDGKRHYTGFEPHVWQEAFAVKWLIEQQIKGAERLCFEDRAPSPRRMPWLCWGPYIWDNTWDETYFTDGVHPGPKARAIFVEKYWGLLRSDAVARPWLLGPAQR